MAAPFIRDSVTLTGVSTWTTITWSHHRGNLAAGSSGNHG